MSKHTTFDELHSLLSEICEEDPPVFFEERAVSIEHRDPETAWSKIEIRYSGVGLILMAEQSGMIEIHWPVVYAGPRRKLADAINRFQDICTVIHLSNRWMVRTNKGHFPLTTITRIDGTGRVSTRITRTDMADMKHRRCRSLLFNIKRHLTRLQQDMEAVCESHDFDGKDLEVTSAVGTYFDLALDVIKHHTKGGDTDA